MVLCFMTTGMEAYFPESGRVNALHHLEGRGRRSAELEFEDCGK